MNKVILLFSGLPRCWNIYTRKIYCKSIWNSLSYVLMPFKRIERSVHYQCRRARGIDWHTVWQVTICNKITISLPIIETCLLFHYFIGSLFFAI